MFGKSRVYLDHAAATPPSPRALRAFHTGAQASGNPSSPHTEGRKAKDLLTLARTRIARALSAKADDVIFTSGATEANNMVIQGISIGAHARGIASPHVLYLPSSHASIVHTIENLAAWGIRSEPLLIQDGAVDIGALSEKLTADTVLVAMDLVCGETGVVWNTREVAHALTKRSIPLLVDASQAPLTERMERTRIGADALVMDAQKIGGVRGTGVLIVPRTMKLMPIYSGGSQERELRPGTENVAGALAFAEAFERAQEKREANAGKWEVMRQELISCIQSIPDLAINEGKHQSPRILNISLPGLDTDYLVALLDEAGFAVSTKSACESDSETGSRAVLALTNDKERAEATLRISWGEDTTMRDLTRFASALTDAVQFLRAAQK